MEEVKSLDKEVEALQAKMKQVEEQNIADAGKEIQSILDKRNLSLLPVVKFVGQNMETGAVISVKPKQQ